VRARRSSAAAGQQGHAEAAPRQEEEEEEEEEEAAAAAASSAAAGRGCCGRSHGARSCLIARHCAHGDTNRVIATATCYMAFAALKVDMAHNTTFVALPLYSTDLTDPKMSADLVVSVYTGQQSNSSSQNRAGDLAPLRTPTASCSFTAQDTSLQHPRPTDAAARTPPRHYR